MTPTRAAAGGLLAIGLLTGCSGSATGPAPSEHDGHGGATSATSSSAPTEGASGSSDHSSHQAAPSVASDGPKPTEGEVVAGLQRYYRGVARETGVPEDSYDELVTCIHDEVYDSLTVRSANALEAGALTRLDAADAGRVADTTAECGSQLPGASPTG